MSMIGALATSQALTTNDLAAFPRQASKTGRLLNAVITLRNLASQQRVNTKVPWGQPLSSRNRLVEQDKEVLRGVYGFPPADVAKALQAFAGLPTVTVEEPAALAKAQTCGALASFDRKFTKLAKASGGIEVTAL